MQWSQFRYSLFSRGPCLIPSTIASARQPTPIVFSMLPRSSNLKSIAIYNRKPNKKSHLSPFAWNKFSNCFFRIIRGLVKPVHNIWIITNIMELNKMLSAEFMTEALTCTTQNEKCSQLHPGSCNAKAFSQFTMGCRGVFKMYLLVHLIPLLTYKRKKLAKDPLPELRKLLVGFIKSLCFAGGYSMLVRRTICFMTEHFSYNYRSAFIAGVIGGISMIFEPMGRQSEIALYTLNKSMEVSYHMLTRRNWPVRLPKGECWLTAVALAILVFFYTNEPQIYRDNYRRVLDKILGDL